MDFSFHIRFLCSLFGGSSFLPLCHCIVDEILSINLPLAPFRAEWRDTNFSVSIKIQINEQSPVFLQLKHKSNRMLYPNMIVTCDTGILDLKLQKSFLADAAGPVNLVMDLRIMSVGAVALTLCLTGNYIILSPLT